MRFRFEYSQYLWTWRKPFLEELALREPAPAQTHILICQMEDPDNKKTQNTG